MKKNSLKKVKVVAIALTSFLVMALCITALNVFNKESKAYTFKRDKVINILHTNDIHGAVENISYIAEYNDKTANAILVDAGDSTQGKAIATYTKGTSIIKLLNASGYDLSTLGNHEFDYGIEALMNNVSNAKFPFIAANVKNNDGSLLLESKKNNGEYKIIKKAGKKIGFFGISTTETSYKTNPSNIEGVVFEDEIQSAQKVVDKLNNIGCDLVVGLIHVGDESSTIVKSIDMAEKLEGVDLLIDGHSHTEIQHKASNGTVVAQTGSSLSALGKITVTFSNDDVYINTKLIKEEDYSIYGKDKKVEKLYQKLNAELEPILGEVIGKTETDLIANETNEAGESIRVVRNRETSMGDLAADSMLWGAKEFLKTTEHAQLPMISLCNGGGVRANIAAGDITIGDVFNVFPFGNTLSIKVVTPDVLYKTLEFSISSLSLDDNNNVVGLAGSYPQIAGMRFEMDLTKTAYAEGVSDGERVINVYIKNEDGTETLLDRKDTTTKIAMASNDFLIAGGDGFTMLTNLEHIAEGNVLDEILADYITKLTEEAGGCFNYTMDGNRSVDINKNK